MVIVPRAVRDEFIKEFSLPQGIIVRTLTDGQRKRAARLGLGRGESEAITLAYDLNVPLVIDDEAPRNVAKRFKIRVIGSAQFLIFAFKQCHLTREQFEEKMKRLFSKGRISQSIYQWSLLAQKGA